MNIWLDMAATDPSFATRTVVAKQTIPPCATFCFSLSEKMRREYVVIATLCSMALGKFWRAISMFQLESAAAMFRNAVRGKPVPPLRDTLGSIDAVGGYAVLAIDITYWLDSGRRIVGKKTASPPRASCAMPRKRTPTLASIHAEFSSSSAGVAWSEGRRT